MLALAPWEMYFDGASRMNRRKEQSSGVGIIFITPEGHLLPHSFALLEPCSNNVAEYQALIMGMELARELAIRRLEVRGDSLLIVNQMNNVYEVRKPAPSHISTLNMCQGQGDRTQRQTP